jgi:hypothetical protein
MTAAQREKRCSNRVADDSCKRRWLPTQHQECSTCSACVFVHVYNSTHGDQSAVTRQCCEGVVGLRLPPRPIHDAPCSQHIMRCAGLHELVWLNRSCNAHPVMPVAPNGCAGYLWSAKAQTTASNASSRIPCNLNVYRHPVAEQSCRPEGRYRPEGRMLRD